MTEENPLKILFVVNPVSGATTKTDWESSIRDFFEPLGITIALYTIDAQHTDQGLKDQLKRFNPQKVVAVGGDGTVSLVARHLVGTGMALGIVPAGSANGMARELGLPMAINDAFVLIAGGNIKDADVIKINDEHICLHLSDIGLNAKLIKHFEEGKLRGKLGYATKVLKTLWTKSSIFVRISTENKEVWHEAFMVVVANARMYGTGAVINPEGDLYDGKFEVVIVRRIALSEILKMLFRPQPFNPKKIKLFQTSSVFIQTSRATHFQVDGEYLGKVKNVEAHIMAGQLKLIVS